ncbi:hypothetical protein, partial [Enterobacter asburiae]|uniref:hypothetical protein n=1 Tax=Enterobacter asburiae TaxID=61645 RepID=UPI0020060749
QVENMSVEGLFVHGGDLWRLNTPLSCLQPPHQGKTHINTVVQCDITHGRVILLQKPDAEAFRLLLHQGRNHA